eukprot:m.157321 g.157321  ORF g.157321 m.157321 type:complete len:55 (+) comp15112_c0_seq4:480-644(+)
MILSMLRSGWGMVKKCLALGGESALWKYTILTNLYLKNTGKPYLIVRSSLSAFW